MSFCFLYNVVLENYSVQNSPWGEGGLLPAQGLESMWPERVSNPGPLTYESGALTTALRGSVGS